MSPAIISRVERLLEAGDAAWCPMIQLELWRGVHAGAERKALEFLEARIASLPIDDVVWHDAVQLMLRANAQGLTAPAPDVLIVATALRHRVHLEHCDQHLGNLLALRDK